MGAQMQRRAYSRVCGASTAKRPAALGYAGAGPAVQNSVGHRQHDGKPRPFADLALDFDPPMVGFGDPLADRETQARAFLGMRPSGVRPVEPIEDPAQLF